MALTLRGRIVIISSATVVGALILSGAVTYAIVRANTMDVINANLNSIAGSNTATISQWVASKERAVTETAATVEHGDPQGHVAQMARNDDFVATVGWTDKTFFSTAQTPPTYDPTARPWYKAAIDAAKLVITKPYPDSVTGQPFVAFTTPMIRDGKAVGVLSGAVTLDGIRDVVKAVHPTPSSLAFVVSKDGQVIAHPDAALALKPTTDVAPELTPDRLTQMAGADSPSEVTIAGAPKLLSVTPVKGTDWDVVIALDKTEATTGLRSMIRTMATAMVVLTLAAVGVAIFLTSGAFRRLGEVRDAMQAVASGTGDLTQRLPVAGNDEVAQIADSFNRFVAKLHDVIRRIRDASASVQHAASEIASGNLDLSRRTEAAAASLQQTAASMEEITSTVTQAAGSARLANETTSAAAGAASRGGQVVAGVVSTMRDIEAASGKINDIIGVIDSIAFQTNILALNAAVEAARAGDGGRGFAVVAGEVRTLAQRSAQAAKEIKVLIATNVDSVSGGASLVKEAGQTMEDIVGRVSNATAIIGEIAGAADEQTRGIQEVNRAVAQLDEMIQQNAALVEQSAAAASTLQTQATDLAEAVGQFRVEA
ncbi:methyl-accepting chemotaxis protein [Paraburkholderia sp. ZP32-5]|uniref:methyl-accepting chemotaxis protein n=1 Tax=Paraburkholderia sp. ZP32-5 TaxID=2883245 RepID=UPI001F36B328|nr:methyl-accepting chemotaxis protein [Paraburkholderia sp. ZP32-5]